MKLSGGRIVGSRHKNRVIAHSVRLMPFLSGIVPMAGAVCAGIVGAMFECP